MRRLSIALLTLALPALALAQSESSSSTSSESAASSSVEASSSAASVSPTTQTATITIEQVALDGVLGEWVLAVPDRTQRTGNGESVTLTDMPTGSYVLYLTLPNGAKSTIRITRNGVAQEALDRYQTPFPVSGGDVIRIAAHYRLDKTGIVSVQSDPPGTAFTLTGPNGISIVNVTPQSYEDLPEGQYKVQYESFAEGCVKPAPKASQLEEDGRISFTIRFECDPATDVRKRQAKDDKTYLTIVTDGKEVRLHDVKQSDWFSSFVYDAAKRDILSGYRDANGEATGEFGPGNNVTVAELSKIAHRMAGYSEEAFRGIAPHNTGALVGWFAPFIGSSESRGWVIYADAKIDPIRPATRAEVVVTLLQAFEVPLRWAKGNVFHDVSVLTPYAAAIETAAGDKIIAGRTDESGQSTGIFDPSAPITRAEIAKIVTTMLDTYESPTTLKKAADRER